MDINDAVLEILLEERRVCYRCKKEVDKPKIYFRDGNEFNYNRDNLEIFCTKCYKKIVKKKSKEQYSNSTGGGYIAVSEKEKRQAIAKYEPFELDLDDHHTFVSDLISEELGQEVESRTIKHPKVKSRNGVLLGIYSEI